MRQIVTTRNGGIEVLEVQEAPDPQPGKGEVVVQVKAAGLNFADIMARQGLYPDGPKKPCVMGYEVAGVVEAVGEDVDAELRGKAVVAMTRFRGQAEKVVVAVNQLFEKPESLSFEQAAAVPVNYLTALRVAGGHGRTATGRIGSDSQRRRRRRAGCARHRQEDWRDNLRHRESRASMSFCASAGWTIRSIIATRIGCRC